MTFPLRIIAIDPGFDRCGVAILEKNERGDVARLHSTCITTDRSSPLGERLLALRLNLLSLIEEWRPHSAAIEKLFFAKNTVTALSVAEAVGVIRMTLTECHLIPTEYTPATIKQSITSYGSSDKKAVFHMTELILRLPKEKRLDDEIDALALGLTHAFHL